MFENIIGKIKNCYSNIFNKPVVHYEGTKLEEIINIHEREQHFFDETYEFIPNLKEGKVYIYILKCEENKFYVGKTKSIVERLKEHKEGTGSAFTKKYKVRDIDKVYSNCDDFDEDKYVKKYMSIYGIDNVRGGSYSQIKLSKETIQFLQKEINSSLDLCSFCGMKGHFINYCPKNKAKQYKDKTNDTCYKCGKKGHWSTNCNKNYNFT